MRYFLCEHRRPCEQWNGALDLHSAEHFTERDPGSFTTNNKVSFLPRPLTTASGRYQSMTEILQSGGLQWHNVMDAQTKQRQDVQPCEELHTT